MVLPKNDPGSFRFFVHSLTHAITMKEVDIHLQYLVYDNLDDLPESDQLLLEAARSILNNAYAPYSAYKVGAAVRLENGTVVTGSNQENVAYPSGLCAERVALFYASSKFSESAVSAIAITASAEDFDIQDPVTPCGACRQVIAETEQRYGNHPIRIIMQGERGRVFVVEGINNLLPLMFHAEELKK